MSNRQCAKAAICCSGLAAKIKAVDNLILARFIEDEDDLKAIIKAGDRMDEIFDRKITARFRDDD